MSTHETPLVVEYIPEARLRALARRYEFEKHLSGDCGRGYLESVGELEVWLESRYRHRPSAEQLRRIVAAAIYDDDAFVGYIVKEGGAQLLDDDNKLTDLAIAAAGLVVGMYRESSADYRRGDRGD